MLEAMFEASDYGDDGDAGDWLLLFSRITHTIHLMMAVTETDPPTVESAGNSGCKS